MAYVTDSNCFIQPKNQYYGMDFCPAYWDWLLANIQSGLVISIDRVYDEIQAQQDELAGWASKLPRGMFFPSNDPATITHMANVSAWVQSRQTQQGDQFYSNATQSAFFGGGADPFLIAYAVAHGHTLVTCEGNDAARRNKVLIPVVCHGLNVPCVSLFDMLRNEQARFALI